MAEKVAKAAADKAACKVVDPDAAGRGPPIATYSIPEFCYCHGISQAQYFAMKARDEGPREMHVGRRRLISIEAAAEWRRGREARAISGDQT